MASPGHDLQLESASGYEKVSVYEECVGVCIMLQGMKMCQGMEKALGYGN